MLVCLGNHEHNDIMIVTITLELLLGLYWRPWEWFPYRKRGPHQTDNLFIRSLYFLYSIGLPNGRAFSKCRCYKVREEKGLAMGKNREQEVLVSHRAESLWKPKNSVGKSKLLSQLSRTREGNETEDKNWLIPNFA